MAAGNNNGNGDKRWERRRRQVGFYGGMTGAFLYCGATVISTVDFHVEFLILFATMMGLSVFQGIDKK